MKKTASNIILSIALSLISFASVAQKNGIAVSLFNASFYSQSSIFTQGYMGIGFERNVGDYNSLKIEINKGFKILYTLTDAKILTAVGKAEKDVSFTDSLSYTSTFYYHWTMPTFEINYQSKFFFAGNDRTGGYMAMGIGMRTVKYQLHVGNINDEYGNEEIPSDIRKKDGYEETKTIIPLMLRVGIRGNLKGFYPDVNFGIGYNIGHNKTVTDKTITKTYDLTVPKISGLAINASVCFGIGW